MLRALARCRASRTPSLHPRSSSFACAASTRMAPKHDAKPSFPEKYVVPERWTPPGDLGGKFGGMNRPTAGARFERALPVGKHPLQLYSLGTPNGQKVTVLLEELGLDYDAWKCDIVADPPAQFSSGFVEANPNSKIPVLMDHRDAKSHGAPPTRVFESCHILLHLCEAAGASGEKFLPSARVDPRGRTECLNWLFWQAASAPYIGGGFGHFYNYAPANYQYAIDRFAMETKRQLDVLDKQLAGKTFVVERSDDRYADAPTIADFAIYPWVKCIDVHYEAGEFLSLKEDYANITRWCETLERREGVKRGMRVNAFGPGAVEERHSAADFD